MTNVSYTRVISDRQYGNHQATAVAQVDEADDPAVALAEVRRLACEAAEAEERAERERGRLYWEARRHRQLDPSDEPDPEGDDDDDPDWVDPDDGEGDSGGDSDAGYDGIDGDREQRVTDEIPF